MVFELLSVSVFDFLKENEFKPFPQRHVQAFARQLFKSVAFLHGLTLVHTDLKPENILLVNGSYQEVDDGSGGKSSHKRARRKEASSGRSHHARRILDQSDIRLIDFGSAVFDSEYHPAVVSTRHYRAPEIVLGLGWSYACDVWSIGCILVEFLTGCALFQTHDNLEHLAIMNKVLGPLPDDLIKQTLAKGLPTFKYFTYSATQTGDANPSKVPPLLAPYGTMASTPTADDSNPYYASFPPMNQPARKWQFSVAYPAADTTRQSVKFVESLNPLDRIILAKRHHMRTESSGSSSRSHASYVPSQTLYLVQFYDLVRKCLDYDAERRITARDALKHPFFHVQEYDDE
jgi:serine/threonine protein kinase